MPFYHRLGEIPHKRHTQFKKPDGTLYREELKGSLGFSGIASLLYHHHMPTASQSISAEKVAPLEAWDEPVRHHHLDTNNMQPGGTVISGRVPILFNSDIIISLCCPADSMEYFYRNGEHDEMIFVHHGTGVLHSVYGKLPFHEGDYIIIPRGTVYQMELTGERQRFFLAESSWPLRTPKRYRNEFGQLLEHSPFCERDIRCPEELHAIDESGEFPVRVKARGMVTTFVLDHHPFDVVGWDGYLYPWIFNIDDFEPITGRIHQPPPVHQTFETEQFVVCSFVPRLFDYHPLSIPAPYYHHNVDSDEIIYYTRGEFMSRKGIHENSVTYHPGNAPHGPQPGKVEESIGAEKTDEVAVMIDTFKPLKLTLQARDMDDLSYAYSWVE